MKKNDVSPPKVFWKYYDLYRRKQISLTEFSRLSGLSEKVILAFIKTL